jgi:hypothetical protein
VHLKCLLIPCKDILINYCSDPDGMSKWEKDRTGETCPFCHIGKLYPTGRVSREDTGRKTGELGRSDVTYQCDKCQKATEASGVGLGATLDDPKFEFKATEKTENK